MALYQPISHAKTKISDTKTLPPPSSNCTKYELFEIWIGTIIIPIKAHKAKRISHTVVNTNRKGISFDLSLYRKLFSIMILQLELNMRKLVLESSRIVLILESD